MSAKSRLPALTGVRFLAAAQMVVLHYGLQNMVGSPDWLRAMVGAGGVGVQLFFVLSGFILTYTYQAQDGLRGTWRRFWWARFARIYPLYLLSLVVLVPLELRAGENMRSGI